MKRICLTLIICLLTLSLFTACATAPVLPDITPTPEAVGLPSPIHEVDSYQALLSAQPDNMLYDAPEGATDVSYCYIDGDPVISQILFTLEGNEYTYRAARREKATQADISGVYDDLGTTKQLQVEDNVTQGGTYTLRYAKGQTKGLATWYYEPTGCQYSLWTPTGCDVTQQIEEVVDLLLPIATDAQGNLLTSALSTPLPAFETGTLKGTVVDIQANVLTLHLDSNNTLQFLLSHIKEPGAQIGDVVQLTYSGNPLDAPEALTITVLSTAPAAPTVSGTVYSYTDQSLFLLTTSDTVFGFIIDGNTVFKGASKTLKTGNSLTVSYTGKLDESPVATVIETTQVSAEPEPTAQPDDPTNKRLKGTVISLSTKSVTIRTDTGHTYSFQRDGSTVMSGDYALENGGRIRVLYDGYASSQPHAKRIDVLAPPDPTPPDPTPYEPKSRTIHGTITMSAGNALVVTTDSGAQYSFLLRSPSISGELIVGYRASVTYRVEADGSDNVTSISTTPPIVYEPGPVLLDQPPQ